MKLTSSGAQVATHWTATKITTTGTSEALQCAAERADCTGGTERTNRKRAATKGELGGSKKINGHLKHYLHLLRSLDSFKLNI